MSSFYRPERILGPNTVVSRQSGNCFEMAIVLCSLLLGAGYNAYVASGFATQDITERIRYRTECPIKTDLPKEEISEEEIIENKYKLRPIRDLRSKFLLYMEQREIDRAEKARQDQLEKERLEREEREKAPPDVLQGWRVHCWVLLLKKRDITEPIFVEPSTGEFHQISSKVYYSLESVWNTENYWVNLQDCSHGMGNLQFDLSDLNCWEHLFIGEPLQHRQVLLDPEADVDENSALDEKHLDVPTPWSDPIVIPNNLFTMRFSKGKKVTRYNRTIIEQYGDYVQFDGLKHTIYHYADFECTDLLRVENTYEHRNDFLTAICSDIKTKLTTEYFRRGREDACKIHTYDYDNNVLEAFRYLEYYSDFRLDGLAKLEMDPVFLKETFKNKDDNLSFRHAVFAERGKPPPGMTEGARRVTLSITEFFNRNPAKEANDDVAIREFAIIHNRIHLKYHYAKGHVTASTREFIKPNLAEMGEDLVFNPKCTSGYQAELDAKSPKQLELFYLLEAQLKEEQKVLYHLREMEDEVSSFIRSRAIETAIPQLDISLFNREMNEDVKGGLKGKEEIDKLFQEKEISEDIDYLAPYIVRIGSPSVLTTEQADKVKEACLKEFSELLVKRINTLRNNMEYIYQQYLEKQKWFSKNLSLLDIEVEENIINNISNLKYKMNIYDIMLYRHLELSASRYKALDLYLSQDKRLAAASLKETPRMVATLLNSSNN